MAYMMMNIRLGWLVSLLFLFSSCYKEHELPVNVDFSVEIVDNDYSVPVKVAIHNATTGAETYSWSFEGGSPASSDKKEPGVIEFATPGSYKIILEAANKHGGKDKKEITVTVDPAIDVDFTVTNTQSAYSPVAVNVVNISKGGSSYKWTFEGGIPVSSVEKQPGTIVFAEPGIHKIILEVSNGKEVHRSEKVVEVKPALLADFDTQWRVEDNDMQAPFRTFIQNNTVSATQYTWNCPGGTVSDPDIAEPEIVYNLPGTYTMTLTAQNDKSSQTVSKTITILPNTNLYIFKDVKLGINTAQNTIGCYFSAALGKVLKSNEVTVTNSSKIDFAYYGLNSAFSYNKILSPDDVQHYTFSPIPGAIHTEVINKQESVGSSFSAADFDAMADDLPLQSLSIASSAAGYAQFDNSLTSRVVLFKTQDGRKGAIKIKEYVTDGQQSYIVVDVKMMKQ